MRRILILTVVAIALLALAACGDDDDEATTPTSSGGPSVTAPDSAGGSATHIPNVCLRNPDLAGDDVLIINQPSPFAEVTSPLIVIGEVAYLEATSQIAIYDAGGTVLAEASEVAQQEEIGVISPFFQGIEFTVAEPTPACLWVYERSTRDGNPIHVGQVPLVLLP